MSKDSLKQRCAYGALIAVLAVAASAAGASAQEIMAAAGLDEIVIFAEKRRVDLQKAPLSVSVVPSDILEKGAISDATGLNGYVPGLQISNSGGSERIVSIRGVGQQTPENFFTQPGVSFHIDGVYIPNSIALNMAFFDTDRIEVARGPQGTVYGQSSTGGAINMLTKQPKLGDFGGQLQGTFGTHGHMKGYGSINVPIGDTLAVRGAIQRTVHDGYAEATSVPGEPGYELDDADNTHYKLQALWKPTENWTIALSATRYVDAHNGAALKALNDPNPDPRVLTQDYPARFRLRNDLDMLTVSYDFSWATAKLVSAYQKLKHDQSFESDRLDVATTGRFDHVPAWSTETESIMEEFTLTSNTGGAVDWIAGAFFTKLDSDQYVVEYAGTGTPPPLPVPPKYADPSILFTLPFSYQNLSIVNRTSWAVFFQTTWHITDKLRATIGARYNDDKYDGLGLDFYGAFGPAVSRAYHKGVWTGKAEVDYDLTPVNMIYTSFARGYKPGGVNTGTGAIDTPPIIKSEIVETIELGSKNRFLDNHLQINGAAFYTFYDDMQYIQEDAVSFGGGISNIPSARIWGAELEALYRGYDDRLELGGNITTLDGEIVSDHMIRERRLADAAAAAAGFPGNCFFGPCVDIRAASAYNAKGNQPPNLPAISFGLHGSWRQSIGRFGDLTSRVEYLYRSAMQARVFNSADGADDVPSYGQWNLYFEFVPPTDPWRISASLTNVFDEDGVAGRFVDPYGSGTVSNEYIPPRLFLVTFGYTF